MRTSPSIVPDALDRDVYLVLDDFGDRLGRSWCETDEADTDRQTLIRHLLEGQYSSPVRIVAFNTAEGWSRDVTEDIADDLQDAWSQRAEIPEPIEEFIQEHATKKLARQLSFPI
jgi:hypothetical protein